MDRLIDYIKTLPLLKIAGGCNENEIQEAEEILGISFANDFKSYLLHFGQIQARGIELMGLSDKLTTSVVKATIREYERNSFPKSFYVIEDLGIDGILYVQNSNGIVFEYAPGRELSVYADSLENYIKLSQK